MDRINIVYGTKGINQLYQTLEYNLGVLPDHWVLAHLDDFIRFVDDLGGVDVQVSTPLPDDCGGIPPGVFHMDGVTALCYVRSRFSTSDFDRVRRQQEVLQEVFRRFLVMDALQQLPYWYAKYHDTVHSDLNLVDLASLAPLGMRLQNSAIHRDQIGRDQVIEWQVPDTGAMVLLPRRDLIMKVLRQAVDAAAQSK